MYDATDAARTSGSITEFLIGKGWKRTESWAGEECGYIGHVGVCIKPARWQEPGHISTVIACAQHAKIIEEGRSSWERTLIDQHRI